MVKWVHAVYIKDQKWEDHNPPITASWIWKGICKLRDEIHAIVQQQTSTQYKIKGVCRLLMPAENNVNWSRNFWCRYSVPKPRFITWLAMRSRLYTRDRLLNFDLVQDATCVLCSNDIETHDHLFFQCLCSVMILQQITQWMGYDSTSHSLHSILHKCGNIRGNRMKKRALLVAIAATVYGVWKLRNDVIWRKKDTSTTTHIINQIKWSVKNRLIQLCKENDRQIVWLLAL